MRKAEYIAEAVSKITNRKAKRETEKELAGHIDELIEFYLDRSGSKEEAEEKAVADMGEAQSISQKLGKLHTGAGVYLFLAIIGIIVVCVSAIIMLKVSLFDFLFWYIEPENIFESLLGESISSALGDAFDLSILLFFLIFTLLGYFKKKIFLVLVSGAELYLLFLELISLFLEEANIVGVIIPLTLFVLTIILINIIDKERIALGEEKEYFGIPTRIFASFGIAFLIFLLSSVFIMVDIAGLMLSDIKEAEKAQVIFEEYLTQMPNEAVDADTVGNIDFENYGPIMFKSQWEKGWQVDGKYLKPDKLISKTVKGDYYKDLNAYWTSNYNDNYLFYAELWDPYTVDGE